MRKIYNSWQEYQSGIPLPEIKINGKEVDHVKNIDQVKEQRGDEGVKDYIRAVNFVGREKSIKKKILDTVKKLFYEQVKK